MVNTFLPYPDFVKSAKILDYKRLGKQRVEAWQILRALRGETKGWRNHPATNLWRGHEKALCGSPRLSHLPQGKCLNRSLDCHIAHGHER